MAHIMILSCLQKHSNISELYHFLMDGVPIVVLRADGVVIVASAEIADAVRLTKAAVGLAVLDEAVDEPSSSCFFACPNSTFLHLAAKFSEQTVSPILYTAGDIFTNIITLEFPPNES
jgi:hypothetical protein